MEIQRRTQRGVNQIYAPIKDAWLTETPEEKVRQEFICHLVNELGYSVDQMEQEITVTNSDRGTGRARADIVIWRSAAAKTDRKKEDVLIVVECKAENIAIRGKDYFQGLNYASWAGADFLITTNNLETRCFTVLKEKLPDELGQELAEIPKAADFENAKKIEALKNATKAFKRDEFANLLHSCHNIIRNNDKLSPEAAFDEISKILFTKIIYERETSLGQKFSLEVFQKDQKHYDENVRPHLRGEDKKTPYVEIIFRKTKDKYSNEKLFADNDTIRIRQASFESIVKELEKYNLSKTSDDVKGIAFERFLGKTFRGELGQFFTPRTVVDYMVELLDPQEGELICDPCSGSGGFLIKAFEYVRSEIEQQINEAKDQIKTQYFDDAFEAANEAEKDRITKKVEQLFAALNEDLNPDNKESRIYHLSNNCIFGTDANPRMARVSKMNMIMHGDGHGGVHHNDGLLNINGIFENRFDVIVTNPPFGARVDKGLKVTEQDRFNPQKVTEWTRKYDNYDKVVREREEQITQQKTLLSLFDIGSQTTLTEVLFVERCLKLLKSGGRLGIVLPEGTLNNFQLQSIRDYFEGKAKILLITSIPQDVFMASGATVKSSLVFLKKFTDEEAEEYNSIVKAVEKEIEKHFLLPYANANKKLTIVKNDYDFASKLVRDLKKAIKSKKTSEIERAKCIEDLKEWEIKKKERNEVLKTARATFKTTIKQIEAEKATAIKQLVKERFDYPVPIAEVEFAGIDSKGAACENQLIPLKEQFTTYRTENQLWQSEALNYAYQVQSEEIVKLLNAVKDGE